MEKRRRNDAAYFMIMLTYTLAVISRPALVSLLFIPVMALHAFTIDKVLPKVLSRKMAISDALLLSLNAIPYLYFFTPLVLIPATAFSLSIILSYARFKVLPQLTGTLGIALLYMPLVQIFGGWKILDIGIYLIWSTYTLSEAIFVEYKLPFRDVSVNELRATWIFSLILDSISVIFSPLFVLPLIEPTIRYMKPGEKLKVSSEIKELGKKGIKRTLLVFFLLLFILLLGYHGVSI